MGWWWTEALVAWHGAPLPPREEIYWPDSAAAAIGWICELASRWRQVLAELPGADLDRIARSPGTTGPTARSVTWSSGSTANS